MDENLKRKFEFVRSDVRCKDINGIPFISDVESIACECIKKGYKITGCNILTTFGRMLESRGGKLDKISQEFNKFLDDAELHLTP